MSRRNQILIGVALIVIAVGGGWAGWRLVATQRMLTAAESLKLTEDFDQAMELYQRVVSRDSKQYTAHKGIGEVYLALARKLPAEASDAKNDLCRRALEALERSLKLNRFDPEVHMSMGDAYWLVQDSSRAIGAYSTAAAVDPNNRSIMVRIGLFYRAIGDREKAVRWLLAARNIVWTEDVRLALEAMGVK